ncbi:t-SNARE coiled-coil homology domain-containing protein [Haematococcus lacustris]|uniref:t-SNARE coiled-coil homology domain-containing protein n=1 Tax=Haematococcus lacustris TaxID=44745 RepID=A0A699ZKZ3_HAELA|nr:t-SNARE coiled-coil homology domain-containing protein [Haematococcus lacustris]
MPLEEPVTSATGLSACEMAQPVARSAGSKPKWPQCMGGKACPRWLRTFAGLHRHARGLRSAEPAPGAGASLTDGCHGAAGKSCSPEGQGQAGPSSTAASQRDRMLTSSQQLERTNDILQHSKEQLQQTEAIGVVMLKELQGQRQTIQRARHTLGEASNQLQQAEAAVRSMERRNKWFGIF